MKQSREYVVNFGKLKPGKHEYEFNIGDSFYEQFEYSLVKKGNVDLKLTIDKQKETFLILDFDFNGYITLECDRCLDTFDYPVHSQKRLYVKLEEEKREEDNDDELTFLDPEAYEIDLAQYIYEFINLELPLHKTCDLGGKACNPAMMNYLGHVNDKEQEENTDPRWADLKKILGKN